jgi:hypothetical protein
MSASFIGIKIAPQFNGSHMKTIPQLPARRQPQAPHGDAPATGHPPRHRWIVLDASDGSGGVESAQSARLVKDGICRIGCAISILLRDCAIQRISPEFYDLAFTPAPHTVIGDTKMARTIRR